jgi:hypothetical protein
MTDAKARAVGKSLADFRAAHDKSFIVPKKITEALAVLADCWEYEAAFIKIAGISQSDCSAYREKFEDFIVVVGGKTQKRVWCGTKKLATQLREMV